MSDIDALVETVREGIDSDSGDYTTQDIGHAALSELAGIARERDRYREALRILESSEDHRLKAAEAELDRLKDALREILRMGDYVYKPHEFAEIARAALADVGGTEEPCPLCMGGNHQGHALECITRGTEETSA